MTKLWKRPSSHAIGVIMITLGNAGVLLLTLNNHVEIYNKIIIWLLFFSVLFVIAGASQLICSEISNLRQRITELEDLQCRSCPKNEIVMHEPDGS